MANAPLRIVEGGSMDKDKALAAALSQIERNFGKGTVMKFDQGAITQVESISTGSLGLARRGKARPTPRRRRAAMLARPARAGGARGVASGPSFDVIRLSVADSCGPRASSGRWLRRRSPGARASAALEAPTPSRSGRASWEVEDTPADPSPIGVRKPPPSAEAISRGSNTAPQPDPRSVAIEGGALP